MAQWSFECRMRARVWPFWRMRATILWGAAARKGGSITRMRTTYMTDACNPLNPTAFIVTTQTVLEYVTFTWPTGSHGINTQVQSWTNLWRMRTIPDPRYWVCSSGWQPQLLNWIPLAEWVQFPLQLLFMLQGLIIPRPRGYHIVGAHCICMCAQFRQRWQCSGCEEPCQWSQHNHFESVILLD